MNAMSKKELIKKLKAMGCLFDSSKGKGSHTKVVNPDNGRSAIIPFQKMIKAGTVTLIFRKLGLK